MLIQCIPCLSIQWISVCECMNHGSVSMMPPEKARCADRVSCQTVYCKILSVGLSTHCQYRQYMQTGNVLHGKGAGLSHVCEMRMWCCPESVCVIAYVIKNWAEPSFTVCSLMTERCNVLCCGTEWHTAQIMFNTFGACGLYLIRSPDCALVNTIVSRDTTHYKIVLQCSVHLLQPSCLEKEKRFLPSFAG